MSIRRWPLIILVLLLAASSWPVVASTHEPAGADSWTKVGPQRKISVAQAPHAYQIVFDHANPSIVYAGTNQGVYRSTDGGETWQLRNQGLGGYGDLVVGGLVMHPTDSQTLYIGTWGYGLFRSTDSGAHWTRLTDPLASAAQAGDSGVGPEPPLVRAGGVSYTDGLSRPLPAPPEPMLAVPGLPAWPDSLGAGVEGAPRPLSWTPVRHITINPSDPEDLFACIDNGRGLYYSPDGGDSWSKVALGTGSAWTYTFAPSNSQIRYASFAATGSSNEFYRTTDGAASWEPVGSSMPEATVLSVAIHPTNPNIVLAGTGGGGLYRSSDGGDTWTEVGTALPDDTFLSVAFAPSSPSVAYAGGDKVYASTDGGLTWANADASFPTYSIWGLAIHPTQTETVLAGSAFLLWGGVYKRTTWGSPFALKATGMEDTFVLDIEQDPNDANRLFAATWGAGIWRSDDGGVTWNAKGGYLYHYCLKAVDDGGSTILYAGSFYENEGIVRSTDLGDTWEDISGGYGYSSDISFDLESAGSGASRLVAATHEGVEYSDDGGFSWNDAAGLDEGIVLRIARSPTDADKLLAATYGGSVWTSTDAGASWTETGSGLGSSYVYSVVFSPVDANLAYAGSYGVYRSANGGGSWSLYGVSETWIRTLETSTGLHEDLFAGTHDKGVYMAPDTSGYWSPINTDLGELRIRALEATSADTLLAGTAGSSGWAYTIVNRPAPPPIFLPMVVHSRPPVPAAPSLFGIQNPDGDGNYTVSWSAVGGATSYTLQEDDNGSFSSPATAYSGGSTTTGITGRAPGTYYYRVKATNASGSSAWSNAQAVTVSPPTEWVMIKAEDFEGTFPGDWEVKDNNSTNGTYYWGKRNCRPYSGSYSGWAVGGGAGVGLSCTSNYPTYVQAWMKYGPFSLADASDAELTFRYWMDTEPGYDWVFYGASVDGSSFSGTQTSGNSQGWGSRELDLTDVPELGNLLGRPNVWIALIFISDSSVTEPEGVYVDNLVLRKYVGAVAEPAPDSLPVAPETVIEQEAVFIWPD